MIRMILVLFGVLVPCSFVDQRQHLRDTYCLHLQADVIKLGSSHRVDEGRLRERGQSDRDKECGKRV
jgi:hypothetical protein